MLVLAGYEATPAEEITEEMQVERVERVERVEPPPAKTAPQQGQEAPTGGAQPQDGEKLATEKQRAFIGQLVKKAGWTNTDLAEHIAKTYPAAVRDGKGSTQALTIDQASELITYLKQHEGDERELFPDDKP